MSTYWYKNAIFYELDIAKFADGNGDGIGDFAGLTRRLDYLAGLGVTCLWLLPFYLTPGRDNGYDVRDYYNVDPRYGSLGDFVVFMREARERGLRVVVDLVVNHTSDEHPWFQEARRDPDSPRRDYYHWAPEPPQNQLIEMVFPGYQEDVWHYDEVAGAYYRHRFYEFQPDLNLGNPQVRDEVFKIMGFWLELGVSGFRVDAAAFLEERLGGGPHTFLRELRAFLVHRRGDAVLLAEVNVPPDDLSAYFGEGNEVQMMVNFYLNQHLTLALAREEAAPLVAGLRALPPIPPTCEWANFLRNHDELTLDQLPKAEREEVYAEFAPAREMRVFNRGIRRRLAPMLDGNQQRIELTWSLLLTLPGSPVLYYGDEIGMGDDLTLPERGCVRAPLQWSREANAGFSRAPAEQLVCPVISDPPYGYEWVNVRDQRRDPSALINRLEHMISVRRECPEFGWGEWQIRETDDPRLFVHDSAWRGRVVIAVHNLGAEPCCLPLAARDFGAEYLLEVMGDRPYPPPEGSEPRIEVAPYGYRWFRAHTETEW